MNHLVATFKMNICGTLLLHTSIITTNTSILHIFSNSNSIPFFSFCLIVNSYSDSLTSIF